MTSGALRPTPRLLLDESYPHRWSTEDEGIDGGGYDSSSEPSSVTYEPIAADFRARSVGMQHPTSKRGN